MRLVLLALLLCLVADPAQACRCAQQNLAEYFSAAQEVVMARLTGWEAAPGETGYLALHAELLAPAYKSAGVPAAGAGEQLVYSTAGDSAGCGLATTEGAVYLFFAYPQDSSATDIPLRVDSCSGSRVILPADGSAPVGFQDVPARFVAQQLNGLAGLELLKIIARHQPDAADTNNESLVGLLDVAGFSHAGHALLFRQPGDTSAPPVRIDSYADLETREYDYELPAAVVYAHTDGWYRLRQANGDFGWLPPDYAGSFFPYAELPVNRLAYLPLPWHGFLWPEPGAGLPARVAMPVSQREQAVEILESKAIGGSPWFRITVLPVSPCEGGEQRAGWTGWIPAYRENGQPAAWFYSRGC